VPSIRNQVHSSRGLGGLATLGTPLANRPDGDSTTVGVSMSWGSALGYLMGSINFSQSWSL